MNRCVMKAVWLIAFSVAVQHPAGAGIPQLIAYQGRLTDSDGAPLVGDHTVRFRLYDAETGGSTLWEEEHRMTLATQDNGVFSLILGSLQAFGALHFNQPLWVSLEVDGEGEMTPRLRLTAVGYAINADTLDDLNASQLLRADVDAEAKGQLKLTRSGFGLLIQPLNDPPMTTNLLEVRRAAGSSVMTLDLAGTLKVASVDFGSAANDDLVASDVAVLAGGPTSIADSLHSHAAAVPTDLFDDELATDVGQAASAGTLAKAARRDHVHRGVRSLAVSGQSEVFGDVLLAAGTNVTLTQSGQTITIAAPNVGNGDITAVTAGTALTGGGASGDVTLSVDVGTTANKIVQLDANAALPAVSGANLTNLNASNLSSGTVPDARLSSNVSLLGASIETGEVADSTLTAVDTADSFLSAGSGISVSKAAASWQVSATGSTGGDITAVTASTGLSGGGTSGDVTLALATPVAVANGGTGAATFSSGALLTGQGTSAVTTTAVGAGLEVVSSQLNVDCMPIGSVLGKKKNSTFEMGVFGGDKSGDDDDDNVSLDQLWPVPRAGTVKDLRAYVDTAPGSGDSWTVTVRKNGSNTSVSCAISGSGKTCTDSGSVSFAAGDRLGVRFVEGGNASGTDGSGWSACFIPD